MNSIFVFLFGAAVFSFPGAVTAQTFDDLFDDADFDSSHIEKMQKEESLRKEKERNNEKNSPVNVEPSAGTAKAVPAVVPVASAPSTPPAVVPVAPAPSTPAVVPAAPVPAVPKAAAPVTKQPQTFSLSGTKPQNIQIPSMPQIGSGKSAPLPSLGSGVSRKKEDENLSLFEMRAQKTGSSNTNVLDFDIAGIRLKMSPEEAIDRMQEAGFSIKVKNHKIPTLNEWKYRRMCIQQMFFTYDNKKQCVQERARDNNSEYINRIVFENKALREFVTVEFASDFAENQAYRIRYVSKGDHSLGTTDEALYLKIKRRQDFLRLLIKKYGAPDDELALMWGVAGLGATLKADLSNSFLDATIVLEDVTIENQDFDNMSIQDMKEKVPESFSF